jgi:hypothetical protein
VDQEVLTLVKVARLTPAALATARAEALKLEARAYRVSKDVYAHAPPSI